MLHELLVALSGYPGSIFILTEKEEIEVTTTLPYCHPSEIETLNRLCRLGTAHFRLRRFVERSWRFPTTASTELFAGSRQTHEIAASQQTCNDPGLYMQAFCEGIDELLTSYRKTLVQLEEEVLQDPHLTVSYINCRLNEFYVLLPFLSKLVEEVATKKARGCQILDVIHSYCSSGIPLVQTAMKKIQHKCHGVMLKQLSSWLLHGLLFDPYDDLFIQKNSRRRRRTDSEDGVDDQCGSKESRQAESDAEDYLPIVTFSVRGNMVPSYIPMNIVETLLYIGEAVQLLEDAAGRAKQYHEIALAYRKIGDHFSESINALRENEEWQLLKMQAVVDAIRSYVAELLWKLTVEKSNLYGHLSAMKDFYLLGRGELFLAFLDQAGNVLNAPPSVTTERDVNDLFQLAASTVLLEDDEFFQLFHLAIDSKPQKPANIQPFRSNKSETKEWNFLRMRYKVPWPLHVFFTPVILEKYNTIFQFLLHVRRVQIELQKCWEMQMESRHRQKTTGSARQWHLRNCMAFLIDNFQYYLQVDVLESQFSILMETTKTTHDFEQIQKAHHTFLTTVLTHSFLLMKPVLDTLHEFMKFCLQFCDVLKHSPTLSIAQLDTFSSEFEKRQSVIFFVLSRTRSHQSSPHLAQLLLRLNFNDYFHNDWVSHHFIGQKM